MKKIRILILALMMFLTGCGTVAKTEENQKLTVCTSFYAVYDFTKKVAGDRADVINIVPTGTEPHDWEPSSHDMLTISKGSILFYNGLGMESWIDSVKSSVGEDSVKYVELAEGLDVDGSSDPHVWLDPENAVVMTDRIAEALCEVDSVNAEAYKANAENFKAQLTALDEEYKQALEPHKGESIVVSHEAYSYMCGKYDIAQQSIEGIIPETEPSPNRVKEIIDYINENEIKYIFFEELLSPKVAQSISDATGAQLLELNPFEGLTEEEIAAGQDYISVMRENLQNLTKALG